MPGQGILHLLKKEKGLRPLAVVFDVGDVAVIVNENVDERIGIDVIVVVIAVVVVIVEQVGVVGVGEAVADRQGAVDDVLLVEILHCLFPPFHLMP